jgi:hypothetical protein
MAVALAVLASLILTAQTFAAGPPEKADPGLQNALDHLNQRAKAYGLANHAPPSDPPADPVIAEGFKVIGHNALGGRDASGDVWVHGDFAYVGTWADPCTGRGVKIIDVSDPTAPRVIGTAAARRGTSAEDMVVRSVETDWFTGDLMVVGIQRCGRQGGPFATYGAEFWDVTDPYHPRRLSRFGITNGGGGAHEVDLIQRGDNVYAALALPFSEWFDPVPVGDVAIVDVTDPRNPSLASEWGVVDDSSIPQPGPFYGIGSFGAAFGHSVRFSEDGNLLYASYWDRGVITLNIADVTDPFEVVATVYPPGQDGDLHSLTPYGQYLLTNDEDFDPRSPAEVWFDGSLQGYATEHPFVPALWDQPGNEVSGVVVKADNQGCDATDYSAEADGAIVIVQTPFSFFADAGALCPMPQQESMAEAAGAAAVVHRFDSLDTSPQWSDFSEATIPVLFTDVDTADGMVAAESATLQAQEPTWGFLRVFDAESGLQVSQFDDVPNINDLTMAGEGFWSIHNTEVNTELFETTAFVSWYSNGIVALDLDPITDIEMVGQFVPPGEPFAEVWGVAIGDDGLIYASDLGSGLWIIEPTFD